MCETDDLFWKFFGKNRFFILIMFLFIHIEWKFSNKKQFVKSYECHHHLDIWTIFLCKQTYQMNDTTERLK